jgi:hypothetical protein
MRIIIGRFDAGMLRELNGLETHCHAADGCALVEFAHDLHESVLGHGKHPDPRSLWEFCGVLRAAEDIEGDQL